MKYLVGTCCAFGLSVFALSGCVAGSAAGSFASGGLIEVAVTQTCTAGSSADCVAVNGEHVLVTSVAFQDVDVKAVAAVDGQQDNAVILELTQDSAAVLTAVSTEASEAGEDARLVIKVGDDVVSAVRVAEPLRDDQLMIVLPAGVTAEAFAEDIRRP